MIKFDFKCFFIENKDSTEQKATCWEEINSIVAFKRDLLTIDCICLLISCSTGKEIELNEEMEGWTQFCEELPNYLPSCQSYSHWWPTVALPALKTNLTEIFYRDKK